MKYFKLVILLLFFVSSNVVITDGQTNYNSLNRSKEKKITSKINKLHRIQNLQKREQTIDEFQNIERAITQGDISQLTSYFNSRTYLNLENGVSGYYSNNQVYYVLKKYFRKHKVKVFKFSKIYTDANAPYAVGSYDFNTRNGRRSLRVYVSLKRVKYEWKILQITLN